MKKAKITIITETILLIIFFCISSFIFIENKQNTKKIEKNLDSCLVKKSGLETVKESLMTENEELIEQNNSLNTKNEELTKENEKLKKENETLRKN